MQPRLFGTLFYANYVTRALTLYRSLEAKFSEPFTLLMLCMDELSAQILGELNLPNARLIRVDEIERGYPDLVRVKPERTIGEYSWTCTPALMRYMLGQVGIGESVAYLDADLMFFSDTAAAFDEWGENDILIHEHRYSPRNRHMADSSGVFNVGLVGIRNTAQGRTCLERWHDQCIEACTVDSARGLCGDQKYLDQWPGRYDRLTIFRHKGAGLAPWNIDQYELGEDAGAVRVDGVPLIFYHFHAFRVIRDEFLGRSVVIPSFGYDFTPRQLRLVYAPYVKALAAAARETRHTAKGKELSRGSVGKLERRAIMRWRVFDL
jgi:hypothetical protein